MSQTYGKTRWKRFALVMVPSVAATAAIGVSIANSALAASFSISGQDFKVATGHLEGENFAQFGSVDVQADNKTMRPVAISAFDSADIYGLCQSVTTNVPFLGPITLRLEAGQASATDPKAAPVHADNLLIDLEQLNADATFQNINIGQDASTLKGSAVNGWRDRQGNGLPSGDKGFAQAATHATLTNVQQKAWATSAGTFKLPGLKLGLNGPECFAG